MKSIEQILNEIKDREQKATKGPWIHKNDGEFGKGITRFDEEYCVQTVHNHGSSSWSRDIAVAAHGHGYQKTSNNFQNMEFIAAARQDIPRLVKALEEAIQLLKSDPHDKLEANLQKIQKTLNNES